MAEAAAELRSLAHALLAVVREVAASSGSLGGDSLRLSRKISLLTPFFEEIRDFAAAATSSADSASSPRSLASSYSSTLPASHLSCLVDLLVALEAAKKVLVLGRLARPNGSSTNICVQFQYITWQLEKKLGNVPYEHFGISDEVQEQVDLVRAQLRRAVGNSNLQVFSEVQSMLTQNHVRTLRDQRTLSSPVLHIEKIGQADHGIEDIVSLVAEVNRSYKYDSEKMTSNLVEQLNRSIAIDTCESFGADEKPTGVTFQPSEIKKHDSLEIPEDFKCPISLELMKDPVIVSTGQTYERAYIQRWIDCGNQTCPKTQQKLQNITLTPNYVLRSLIMQWCETHKIDQTNKAVNGWIRKSDGTFHEFTGDRAAIEALVLNLSSRSLDDQISAVSEIRSLAKRSTDNRIIIAEAGAIPALVRLLSATNTTIQENAVTALLNLSIYDHNKELIVRAGAIGPTIQVLSCGSMEARENAAATIFSLSLLDESKITIGSTPGALDALIKLLSSGSSRGKKDAATALFNLCIYQGNKGRAVRAGIIAPLLEILGNPSSNGMVDEALTILSVLVSHHEGKVAITKAHAIPLLIDLLRTGQPRTKENAAAILLALSKKDNENLACVARLGALIPLTELAKNGTDRAKRKATTLLEHLSKLQML